MQEGTVRPRWRLGAARAASSRACRRDDGEVRLTGKDQDLEREPQPMPTADLGPRSHTAGIAGPTGPGLESRATVGGKPSGVDLVERRHPGGDRGPGDEEPLGDPSWRPASGRAEPEDREAFPRRVVGASPLRPASGQQGLGIAVVRREKSLPGDSRLDGCAEHAKSLQGTDPEARRETPGVAGARHPWLFHVLEKVAKGR